MTHAVSHAQKKKATTEPPDCNPPEKLSHCGAWWCDWVWCLSLKRWFHRWLGSVLEAEVGFVAELAVEDVGYWFGLFVMELGWESGVLCWFHEREREAASLVWNFLWFCWTVGSPTVLLREGPLGMVWNFLWFWTVGSPVVEGGSVGHKAIKKYFFLEYLLQYNSNFRIVL